MNTAKPLFTIGQSLAVEFVASIMDADGTVARTFPRQKNLLLDAGLNRIGGPKATRKAFTQLITFAAIGTGTNPTYRDSGAATARQVGNAVTISAGFLVAGDTGRLLKYDTGEEVYLTYLTPTTATASGPAQTIAAAEFTIYHISDLGLQAEVKRTDTYSIGAGDNQSAFTAPATWTHKQTYLFPAESAPITYKEIGWSHDYNVGANLFGRALFTVPPVLGIGQQLKVAIFLSVVMSPAVPVVVANVGNNGYNTTGTMIIEWCRAGSDAVGIAGIKSPVGGSTRNDYSNEPLEPTNDKFLGILKENWVQNAGMSNAEYGPALPINTTVLATEKAYQPGSFYQDFTAFFGLSEANGSNHYGINIGLYTRMFTLKFAAPQTKDSDHTLKFTFRFTWGRVLVN